EQPERLHANRMLGGAALLVRRGKKRLAWKLEDDQVATVEAWIGPPRQAHLAFALKQRYGLGLPIGLFLILTSLPFPGDPAAGIDPVPFNLVSAILGGGLIVLWAFSRWRPHPALFILDAAWFTLLALDTVYDIATGTSSMWWVIFAAVVMVFAQSGLGLYKRYRHLHRGDPPPGEPGSPGGSPPSSSPGSHPGSFPGGSP
ncbi:MAG: hypothetical protein AAGF23_19925, partial [Acidobacteriota bacterium]